MWVARVTTESTTAHFPRPPLPPTMKTLTSSPLMASRTPERDISKVPSGVSTTAEPGLSTRSVPVMVRRCLRVPFAEPRLVFPLCGRLRAMGFSLIQPTAAKATAK